ncbi:hypothetical protein D0863_05660 [Hortaea werneckii]|uniref:Peptidase A1 domain-containing protein n=1 Tax=Hortaea werneckii TaxID=91943 RepID=A0A3M7E1R0_HORWE|nr:hypothetical protein D0863_05660 [Hortaea werneckii]
MLPFALALLLVCGSAQVPQSPSPCPIVFTNDSSVGPDGPWWYILQGVDWPPKPMKMIPTQAEISMIVNKSACDLHDNCPASDDLWEPTSDSWRINNGSEKASADVGASAAGPEASELLGLEGSGQYIMNRMTIYRGADANGKTQVNNLDKSAIILSNNYSITYPGGASYTLSTGFFSLSSLRENITWTAQNGTQITAMKILPRAYHNGFIPSESYSLHVGSVFPNITGSLILGGYDKSRCLSEPIVTQGDSFMLTDIGLNVSSGDSVFKGLPSGTQNGLLRSSDSNTTAMSIGVGSGFPYLYLPRSTCDAIAEYLPVTYNENFDLYFWNTDDEAFEQIVTSPHHLTFTFNDNNLAPQTIKVPFALLNLTLDQPLTDSPTPYFPCRPTKVVEGGIEPRLGRAFLQAAFMAKKGNTKFLAQAPGPAFDGESVETIFPDTDDLEPTDGAASWEDTWKGHLKDVTSKAGSNDTEVGGTSDPQSSESSDNGISGGAIAGIVVGVIVGVALVLGFILWQVRRRKKSHSTDEQQQQQQQPGEEEPKTVYAHYATPDGPPSPPQYNYSIGHDNGHKPVQEIHEAEATSPEPVEMDANQDPKELPADEARDPVR